MFDDLNEDNFLMYAAKCYTSPHCIMSEFEGDIKRTKYLKRLFRRYKITKSLKERLIMNHIILLNNVFGPEVATRTLFFKMSKDDYSTLKTYLLFLSYMPERVKSIKGHDILSSDIPVDMIIAETLRKIK